MVVDSDALRWGIYDDLVKRQDKQGHLTRNELLTHHVDDTRLPLLDVSRGIRNVGRWASTLSVLTSERGRYPDREISPGVWRYPYETTPDGKPAPSNTKLRSALVHGTPVLYFYSPVKNVYLLVGMVHVVDDDPSDLEFTIELTGLGVEPKSVVEEDLRRWVRREVDQRLHQPRFRELVLPAYDNCCTVCDLPIKQLLEAAHIIQDRDAKRGQAVASNGLSLCRNHHRAFDTQILGIDADLQIHVSGTVDSADERAAVKESLTQFHGRRLLHIPRGGNAPDPDRLKTRFDAFLAAL
ncbi:HNH endonuclease [uncultured Demequina sp.]|uniref:HNH endonuclease n=1 Tax=uncultured Demequina sp. TaxID=693499 RepID=UPI0025DE3413|nr:HNH endonuclease [uncultured Demequina sp.]